MAQSVPAVSSPVVPLAGAPVPVRVDTTTLAAALPGSIANRQARPRWLRGAIHLLLILGAVAAIFPFYWMLTTAFKSNSEALAVPPTLLPTDWQPENFGIAWRAAPFPRYFANSLLVAFCTVTGVLVVSCLAAYAFARMNFYGKNILFMLFLSTMMIPNEVTTIPNFIIITKWLGWYNTYQAQFILSIGSVFAIFLLRQFFLSIPQELEDAALIDGCSQFRFLWAILVPLSSPALITVALLNFLGSWNAFLWPLLVTSSPELRPVLLGLQVFSTDAGSRHAELMAASTFVILPTVIVFLVAQKYFVEGIARTGLKG